VETNGKHQISKDTNLSDRQYKRSKRLVLKPPLSYGEVPECVEDFLLQTKVDLTKICDQISDCMGESVLQNLDLKDIALMGLLRSTISRAGFD